MKKQTSIIFYVLGVYVILQFVWWGYHLIELTQELSEAKQISSNRVTMIIGEGVVFLLILIAGFWKIQSSIKKELRLAERQKNFLLSVTHELKTPIAANKLFWQTLEKRELTSEQKKDIIQKALQENNRLEQMIDNILNASRIENKALQITREEIDLTELFQTISDRYHKRYQQNFIREEFTPNIHINADRFLIETILSNLIENAVKYAGIESEITLYLKEDGGKIIFGVKDNGPGVPPENREAIFVKFYRGEDEETRSKKGSGLGLFITAEFTRLLGGTLRYKNNNPKGANFEITVTQ